jgi:hypothetical protein
MRAWLVGVVLLCVALSPMVTSPGELEEPEVLATSSPLQVTLSSSTGWTSGGETLTITGTGFADLAHHNTSYDGLTHQWATSTADYADQAGLENAIVMDSSGDLHIVHINGGNYEIRHSVYDGSSWMSNKIGNCEGTYCWDAHMVIDDNDELHVAYAAYSNAVIYRHYDGSTWTSSVASTSAKFGPVGIAVDSNNLPHISYAASGQYCGGGLRLASFDGTSWGSQSIDYGSNKGCDSSIVIDENDHVYIAYQDRDNSKLKFATNYSGSWNTYAPDAAVPVTSMYPGYFTSLAMDDQGQFHIAHFDSKNEDLRYSTGVPNGQWTTTIVDASGHTGRNPSIAIDAAGDPHIVYQTWSGFDLKYATLNPSSPNWQKSNIETTGDLGDSNSIFIDPQGTMHVAYSDETNDVLRYATKATGVIETSEITVHLGNLGSVTAEVVDDETIRLTTPAVANPGTITLSLTDKDGVDHTLSATFEFIDQNDLDGDGVPNASDDCPNVAGTSTQDLNGCPDDDGDGYSNTADAFPNDSSEWLDSDGDGVGDNADAFPNDASETLDSDGDGVGDNADAFPTNGFEQYDSDGDGVGDNGDAFPNDSSEWLDSDGDGVGDNADAFPMNAFETLDSDGDGVGDNTDAFPNDASETHDLDGDGVGDNADAFPNDASETLDSDGDGVGDNADAFPNNANETIDSDGDGVGDNQDECPNSEAGASVENNGCLDNTDSDGDGVVDRLDSCPEVNASALDTDNDGCLDDEDEDGVIDSEDACPSTASGENVSQTGCSDVQLSLLDTDGDGVLNAEDQCPETPATTSVDATGCPLAEEEEDETSTSLLSSFFSGESDPVTTTVGVGAILLALFTLLQTNAVAAVLPDAFRWVQVMRKNSKLTKEELNELTYLQSITQAYYGNPKELAEELEQLRGDLTARYTNNDIKKQTREKLFTLIDELLASTPDQLHRIAHNDAYFGLAGTLDAEDRTRLLNEKLAMTNQENATPATPAQHGQPSLTAELSVMRQWTDENGYTWAEMSDGTHRWWNGTDWQSL